MQAAQQTPNILCHELRLSCRSALEMTLAASLSIASPKSVPSQQQQPGSLPPSSAASGRQPPVAMLTLEAGASPRSIAATNALIASFQSDPGAHETFRPVHHTARAAQRAAKLAHLKAARQAQRLMRPKTSPIDSAIPLSSSQKLRRHSASKVASLNQRETEMHASPPASPTRTRLLKTSSSSAPASPMVSQTGTPLQSERSSAALQKQRSRARTARAHCSSPAADATAINPDMGATGAAAQGTLAPQPNSPDARLNSQNVRPQSLSFVAPGAFIPRQRSGLGPGPHPVHEALQRESFGPVAIQQIPQPGTQAQNEPTQVPSELASTSDGGRAGNSPSWGMHRANGHTPAERPFSLPTSASRSGRQTLGRPQLEVAGSGVMPASLPPLTSSATATSCGPDAPQCSPPFTTNDTDQQFAAAMIIGSPLQGRCRPGQSSTSLLRKPPGEHWPHASGKCVIYESFLLDGL